jgi:DNA replication and repair protein RecF
VPFHSLSLTNYRNLADGAIDLSAPAVFFVGENGQGKSNLLEALYYLAYGSSFRTHSDGEIVKNGETDFSLRAYYMGEDCGAHTVAVYFEKGKKHIEKNGKRISDRKELINTIPCVLYCHEDLDFVTGEPERRRFFIDQTLSMHDVPFIDVSRQYKKTLKSRNMVLKSQNIDMVEVYNQQLVKSGIEIQHKRKALINDFNRIFSDLYEKVTGIGGVHLLYTSSWKESGDAPLTENEALTQLEVRLAMDLQFCTTMSGPHRDRISFVRNKRLFIPTASTGQKRLAAILLRTAQAIFYKNVCGKKPVLLLDDVLLELDPDKRQKVTALLPEYDQLFCTFLTGEPYQRYQTAGTKEYRVVAGTLESCSITE